MQHRPFLLCLLCVGLSFTGFSQNPTRNQAGVFVGASNYQGDLADDQLEFSATGFAAGVAFKHFINPRFQLRATAFRGIISGSDRNSATLRERGYHFSSRLFEVATAMEYHPLGQGRYNNAGIFTPRLAPFAFIGIGYTHADTDLNVPADSRFLFPEANETDHFFVLPVGAGLRIDVIKRISFELELGWRATFSDYLDDVSLNGGPEQNDWYWFGGLTTSYYFGTVDLAY